MINTDIIIEITGACIGLVYLLLEYKASSWLWVFGILMPLCYVFIFFQQGIYANMLLNIYYVGANIYGLLVWKQVISAGKHQEKKISSMPKSYRIPAIVFTLILTAGISYLLYLFHESDIFILDGLTAAVSITGLWMLTKKYYQEWICWIIVNPIMIWLALSQKMYPTAVLYTAYSIISIMGYFNWKNMHRNDENSKQTA